MPVQGAVISNLDGLVFNKGYMYATRLPAGATDAVAFGALQNTTLTHTFGLAEFHGPEALAPLLVGVNSEELSGSFENGVIQPEQFIVAMGGSQVVNGTDTVFTKLTNQEPIPFNLHFESGPHGLDDLDLVLYNCLMPSVSWRMDDRNVVLMTNNFKVYGQSPTDGGKLFTYTAPGSLVNAS